MPKKEKVNFSELLKKVVVSKSGKKFGELSDVLVDTRSGELIDLVIENPTKFAKSVASREDEMERVLLPFSAVSSVTDFVIVSEEEIV